MRMIFNLSSGALKTPVLNTSYPANVTGATVGGSATFKVVIATDGIPASYTYQWYVNGSAVSGATSSSYTKSNLEFGTYTVYCKVTNSAGAVLSRTATLTVTKMPDLYDGSNLNYTYAFQHGDTSGNTGKVNTNHVLLTVSGESNNYAYIRFKVDLTNISKLTAVATFLIEMSGTTEGAVDGDLFIHKNTGITYSGATAKTTVNVKGSTTTNPVADKTMTLDVSSYTGVYYVYCGVRWGSASSYKRTCKLKSLKVS